MGNNTRVTLKNIADSCGYSVNTVSRALRNDSKLPPETISKIQTIADELGYIRNSLASSLRSGHSNVIAILADNLHNPHYSSLITHIDSILRKKGYDTIILCSNNNDSVERHLANIIISHNVDGVLFFPRSSGVHSVTSLISNHIPYVLIDREITGLTSDVVCCDDYRGGYIAGQELCRLGHRKFLYLAGALDIESQTRRENGFFKALEENGISPEQVRIIPAEKSEEAILNNTILELLLPVDYTAILVYKDQTAYSVLNQLRMANYQIPEDISIIGFDHIRQDVPFLPPLSSVACSSNYEQASTAVDLLLQRISYPNLPCEQRILPVSIHDGGTVAPCPQKNK